MRIEIHVEGQHNGDFLAVVAPGNKFSGLAGWGSTEQEALKNLNSGMVYRNALLSSGA